MKRGNWMNYTLLNRHRKNNLENRLSIKMLLCTVILLPIFTILLTTESCKEKGRNTGTKERTAVAFEDIEIGYPDIEGQKKEMQKFSYVIDANNAIEKPDGVLRQITENVPLVFIETHLKELLQKTTPKDRPNISILLGRINEMSNMNDANASEFIDKAKENRNVDKLSVSLFGLRTETQQAKAANALASIKKPEAVRLLTMRLFNAAGFYKGGLEAKLIQEQLRQSLVKALGSCTGLDFSDYDASETATLEIIKRCEEWLTEKGN